MVEDNSKYTEFICVYSEEDVEDSELRKLCEEGVYKSIGELYTEELVSREHYVNFNPDDANMSFMDMISLIGNAINYKQFIYNSSEESLNFNSGGHPNLFDVFEDDITEAMLNDFQVR